MLSLVIIVITVYAHASRQCILISTLHLPTTSLADTYCEDLQTALGPNLMH